MKIISIILTALTMFMFTTNINAQSASNEANTVLQKVKEKVEALKRNPKAYIGTITDKTDTSIQLRGLGGEIELVSVSDTTKYNKINGSDESIEFSDIAIGDYVSALGTFESTQVLSARRVLLSTPPANRRKVTYGKVLETKGKEIAISDSSNEEVLLSFPARWKGPEIKDISEGDLVVAVSTEIKSKNTIRTIQIITPTTPAN